MINSLLGRGSDKASQRGWLLIRIVVNIVERNVGSQEDIPLLGKGKVCRKRSCSEGH